MWSISGGAAPASSPYTSITSNLQLPCHFLDISQFALALSRFDLFRRSIAHSLLAYGECLRCVFTSTNTTCRSPGTYATMSSSQRLSLLHGRTFRPTIRQPMRLRCAAATFSPQVPLRTLAFELDATATCPLRNIRLNISLIIAFLPFPYVYELPARQMPCQQGEKRKPCHIPHEAVEPAPWQGLY